MIDADLLIAEHFHHLHQAIELLDHGHTSSMRKLYRVRPLGSSRYISAKNYLAIDCEIERLDFTRGDQRSAGYAKLNPNMKMPTLEDDGFVLWESNAILFYLAAMHPEQGLWPSDTRNQADVLRWLAWESAHWDAESVGMVSFEKGSKVVMKLGPADPAFIARGEQNFARFATVLDGYLKDKTWLVDERLTLADFSVGGVIPSAKAMDLSIAGYPQISRWYDKLSALPGWHSQLST